MLEPHGSPMKWPGTGAEDEAGEAGLQSSRVAQTRAQDDAAVHYVFQREPQESELPSLAPKQRWAVGDDAITEVSLYLFTSKQLDVNITYKMLLELLCF